MRITLTRVGAALLIAGAVVEASAVTLVSSSTTSSALTVSGMSRGVLLASDITLASDLKRMTTADRSLVLSQHGVASEAALAMRITDTRERIRAYMVRQERVGAVIRWSSGFLVLSVFILGLISLKVALTFGDRKSARDNTTRA